MKVWAFFTYDQTTGDTQLIRIFESKKAALKYRKKHYKDPVYLTSDPIKYDWRDNYERSLGNSSP